jgi:hypothetical protein
MNESKKGANATAVFDNQTDEQLGLDIFPAAERTYTGGVARIPAGFAAKYNFKECKIY